MTVDIVNNLTDLLFKIINNFRQSFNFSYKNSHIENDLKFYRPRYQNGLQMVLTIDSTSSSDNFNSCR